MILRCCALAFFAVATLSIQAAPPLTHTSPVDHPHSEGLVAGALTQSLPPLGVQPPTSPFTVDGIWGGGLFEFGQRVSLNVRLKKSSLESVSVQWKKDGVDLSGATNETLIIESARPEDGGEYAVLVSSWNKSLIHFQTVSVQPARPISSVTVAPSSYSAHEGAPHTLMALATGSYPRTYQWRKNGIDIPDATNESYAFAALTFNDFGGYSVVVSNNYGPPNASEEIFLYVNYPEPILIDPFTLKNQSVSLGAPLKLNTSTFAGSGPLLYQWKKDGQPIPGATDEQFLINAASYGDAGKYSVTISNPAGSATSNEAVVTVIPATPITFSKQPVDRVIFQGQSWETYVATQGSAPISYQWYKDGVLITGATDSVYEIPLIQLDSGGTYKVLATNPAGSASSAEAVLTVNPAVAPAITQQPVAVTADYLRGASISMSVSGTEPLYYQWKKDGVSIKGATHASFFFDQSTPSLNGEYTLTVTNVAGSITSSGVTLTVRPAAFPAISRIFGLESLEIAMGTSTTISMSTAVIGTGPLTFQWYKDGLAMPDAKQLNLVLRDVTNADVGNYWLVASGAGGTAVGPNTRVSVLPPLSAAADYSIATASGSLPALGQNGTIYAPPTSGGVAPLSYQWRKNGVPIPGATSATLVATNATCADLSSYSVVISDAWSIAASPNFFFTLPALVPDPVTAWLDVIQFGDVVYFLAASPGRIDRFSLVSEQWLPSVLLTNGLTPTAFLPASTGVYVAYGRKLVVRSVDLASETPILDAPNAITQLCTQGNLLYLGFSGSFSASLRTDTLSQGPNPLQNLSGEIFRRVAAARTAKKLFALNSSGGSLAAMTIDSTGVFQTPVRMDLLISARSPFLFPNEERVADDSGSVYLASDLTYAGSLGNRFDDLTFLADGSPAVLRGNTLTVLDKSNYADLSRIMLPRSGQRCFGWGTSVYIFSAENGVDPYSVTRVSGASPGTLPQPGISAAPLRRYSIDAVFAGNSGIVHVVSRSLNAVVRWSSAQRQFLTSVPLHDTPSKAFHQFGNSRALLAYADGNITALALDGSDNPESFIAKVPCPFMNLTDLGDSVLIETLENYFRENRLRLTLTNTGTVRYNWGRHNWHLGAAWNGSLRRLYSDPTYLTFPYLIYGTLSAAGLPVPPSDYGRNLRGSSVLRFNPAGTRVVTSSGSIRDADLAAVGQITNSVQDAAWLPSALFTIRGVSGESQVQRWTPTSYLAAGDLKLAGTPLGIFRITDTQLVAITKIQGLPQFTLIDFDLAIVNAPVGIATQPQSRAASANTATTLTIATAEPPTLLYQWYKNATLIAGATSASLTLNYVQPVNAGIYSAFLSAPATAKSAESAPAILGVSTTAKVIGAGSEVGTNIAHPNGNVYDQLLLSGTAATITADPGQVTRLSFADLDDDLVQVEFAGAGTLSLVLDSVSSPAAPVKYNQPSVAYMKGHASIVITGANETTNVSVFSVGKANAVNQALFKTDATYDGVADLAYIAILSSNGKFGGVRTANTSFFAVKGFTGVYAPGVQFTGPVFIGDINASDSATPTLTLGSSTDVRITGGSLQQTNTRAVQVSGITQLKFTDGGTSHGIALPAQTNKARFEQNGVDVTTQIVVNP